MLLESLKLLLVFFFRIKSSSLSKRIVLYRNSNYQFKCSILAKLPFATSKVLLCSYYNQHSIRFAQELLNDLRLRILGNEKYQEKINTMWRKSLVLNLTSKNKKFVIVIKNDTEAIIKVFCSCRISLISLICCKYFPPCLFV